MNSESSRPSPELTPKDSSVHWGKFSADAVIITHESGHLLS